MKLTVFLALTGLSQAAIATKGCITKYQDESTVSGCKCDSTCKLCGYTDYAQDIYAVPVDKHPISYKRCMKDSCNEGRMWFVNTPIPAAIGEKKFEYVGTCVWMKKIDCTKIPDEKQKLDCALKKLDVYRFASESLKKKGLRKECQTYVTAAKDNTFCKANPKVCPDDYAVGKDQMVCQQAACDKDPSKTTDEQKWQCKKDLCKDKQGDINDKAKEWADVCKQKSFCVTLTDETQKLECNIKRCDTLKALTTPEMKKACKMDNCKLNPIPAKTNEFCKANPTGCDSNQDPAKKLSCKHKECETKKEKEKFTDEQVNKCKVAVCIKMSEVVKDVKKTESYYCSFKQCIAGLTCQYPDISGITFDLYRSGNSRFNKAASYTNPPFPKPPTTLTEKEFNELKDAIQKRMLQTRLECVPNKQCSPERQQPEGGMIKEKCMLDVKKAEADNKAAAENAFCKAKVAKAPVAKKPVSSKKDDPNYDKRADKTDPNYNELSDPLSAKFDKRTDKTLATYDVKLDPTVKATVGAKKSDEKPKEATGNAGKGQACVSTEAKKGCAEGMKCAKIELSGAALESANKKAKAAGTNLDAINKKEQCIGTDKCDTEIDSPGVKYVCGAKALTASLVAAFALVLSM